ncbi:MAG: hypothetical protein ACNI3C_11340 [Candidatus Marinarcus sp.]|uniref:hypothetical protein n=1 Tax=Candidatus Marinarcus sp. TaxID=3100987 RepID=UPI003AFF9511
MRIITPIFIVLIISIFSYSLYKQIKKDLKIQRVSCQEKTVTFEKIYHHPKTKLAIELLKSNNYTLQSHIEYSQHMKSKLIDILTIDEANTQLHDTIASYVFKEKPNKDRLIIDYYIYENDKKDLGKKQENSKKYAGYLVFEFKLNNTLLYKIQSDYMKLDASDIPERMNCIIQSFISLKDE